MKARKLLVRGETLPHTKLKVLITEVVTTAQNAEEPLEWPALLVREWRTSKTGRKMEEQFKIGELFMERSFSDKTRSWLQGARVGRQGQGEGRAIPTPPQPLAARKKSPSGDSISAMDPILSLTESR